MRDPTGQEPFHPLPYLTETDPVSKTLCLKKAKMIDNVDGDRPEEMKKLLGRP